MTAVARPQITLDEYISRLKAEAKGGVFVSKCPNPNHGDGKGDTNPSFTTFFLDPSAPGGPPRLRHSCQSGKGGKCGMHTIDQVLGFTPMDVKVTRADLARYRATTKSASMVLEVEKIEAYVEEAHARLMADLNISTDADGRYTYVPATGEVDAVIQTLIERHGASEEDEHALVEFLKLNQIGIAGPRWNGDDAPPPMIVSGVTRRGDQAGRAFVQARSMEETPQKGGRWRQPGPLTGVTTARAGVVRPIKPLGDLELVVLTEGPSDALSVALHPTRPLPAVALRGATNLPTNPETLEDVVNALGLLTSDKFTWDPDVIVIAFDADQAGSDATAAWAPAIANAFPGTLIRVHEWPEGAKTGKDITDLYQESEGDAGVRELLDSPVFHDPAKAGRHNASAPTQPGALTPRAEATEPKPTDHPTEQAKVSEVLAPDSIPVTRDVEKFGDFELAPTVYAAMEVTSGPPVAVVIPGTAPRAAVFRSGLCRGLFGQVERKTRNAEGNEVWETRLEHLTDWVAWREASVEIHAPSIDGSTRVDGDPTFDVVMMNRYGKLKRLRGLAPSKSASPTNLVDAGDHGLSLPESRAAVTAASNMILNAGFQGQTRGVAIQGTGHVTDPVTGAPVFAAPGGSVDADGPRPDLAVYRDGQPVTGDDPGSKIRVSNVPRDDAHLRQTFGAIKAAFTLAPNRPEAITAVLATVFGAPLALPGRAAPVLYGEKGSGKSHLESLAAAFQTGSGAMQVVTLDMNMNKSSKAFVSARLAWARHVVTLADDYKTNGASAGDIDVMNMATDSLLQSAGGASAAGRGTQTGGERVARPIVGTAILSAEVLPKISDSAVDRSILIPLAAGDVRFDGDDNPVDRYRAAWDQTGLANTLYSAFVRWTVQRVAQAGSLAAFSRENEAGKRDWANARNDKRASEQVAFLAMGIENLYRFAESEKMTAELPPRHEFDEALDTLVTTGVAQRGETDRGATFVQTLADWLESAKGHLTTIEHGRPAKVTDALAMGWRPRETSSGETLEARGVELGVFSERTGIVTITAAGAKVIWGAATGEHGAKAGGVQEIGPLLAPRVIRSKGGEAFYRPAADRKSGQRAPRGFHFHAADLGISLASLSGASRDTRVLATAA